MNSLSGEIVGYSPLVLERVSKDEGKKTRSEYEVKGRERQEKNGPDAGFLTCHHGRDRTRQYDTTALGGGAPHPLSRA